MSNRTGKQIYLELESMLDFLKVIGFDASNIDLDTAFNIMREIKEIKSLINVSKTEKK